MKVSNLIEIIKERTDIASKKFSIYLEMPLNKNALMDENKTLEYYGLKGNGEYNDVLKGNEKTILYFDYAILGNNCPILNSDFYFHSYSGF